MTDVYSTLKWKYVGPWRVHLIFTAPRYSLGVCAGKGHWLGRINPPFIVVVLNSFQNIIKAIFHLSSRKRVTETMTVDTNGSFAAFAIGQESRLRMIVAFSDNGCWI